MSASGSDHGSSRPEAQQRRYAPGEQRPVRAQQPRRRLQPRPLAVRWRLQGDPALRRERETGARPSPGAEGPGPNQRDDIRQSLWVRRPDLLYGQPNQGSPRAALAEPLTLARERVQALARADGATSPGERDAGLPSRPAAPPSRPGPSAGPRRQDPGLRAEADVAFPHRRPSPPGENQGREPRWEAAEPLAGGSVLRAEGWPGAGTQAQGPGGPVQEVGGEPVPLAGGEGPVRGASDQQGPTAAQVDELVDTGDPGSGQEARPRPRLRTPLQPRRLPGDRSTDASASTREAIRRAVHRWDSQDR